MSDEKLHCDGAANFALKSKRICVTGGAGFLGSHVVERLREAGGRDVFVVRHAEYDLTQPAAVERLMHDARPQVIIHLAATVGGIGANLRHPGRFFYENLIMGAQLIESARQHEVEKLVVVGTVCAYPKHTSIPFKEDDLWAGYPEETNAPYGIAKKALLVQCQAYRAEYGLNAIYLLPANLYGVGDDFDSETSHVIPAIIKKCLQATGQGEARIELWGTGDATREFLFAKDAAEGIVLATEKYDSPEPVNLGTNVEISIRDLARMIAEETGFTGEIIWDTSKPEGQPRRALDTSRAAAAFGFRARTNLREGLRKTIKWYRQTAMR